MNVALGKGGHYYLDKRYKVISQPSKVFTGLVAVNMFDTRTKKYIFRKNFCGIFTREMGEFSFLWGEIVKEKYYKFYVKSGRAFFLLENTI